MSQDERVTVNLRIEGKNETIFEDTVSTCGHRVTTRTGKTHHCNGTNNNQNPCAGPTCTTALDDARKVSNLKFDFDGNFDENYDDFNITSIDGEAVSDKYIWAIACNFKRVDIGGCQKKVKKDDQVLFAYTAADKPQFLKLSGGNTARINRPIILKVTDGATGAPIQNATIEGRQTDAQGQVSIKFPHAGTQRIKAEKEPESGTVFIRSNELVINVLAR